MNTHIQYKNKNKGESETLSYQIFSYVSIKQFSRPKSWSIVGDLAFPRVCVVALNFDGPYARHYEAVIKCDSIAVVSRDHPLLFSFDTDNISDHTFVGET